MSDRCFDGRRHAWEVRYSRGHDEVGCAKCYRCLSAVEMLRAYVAQEAHQETKKDGET